MSKHLIGLIGDEDTVTGFLLSGAGQIKGGKANYFEWNEKTPPEVLKCEFESMHEREDISIILICQKIAAKIRYVLDDFNYSSKTLIEIPSKDCPYDPDQDSLLKQVTKLFEE